ncbi:hypothetical protein KKF38_02740 [Patescibacteria group bacterium]|nr:hypothetical protein [Patescibacteria group bacterium]
MKKLLLAILIAVMPALFFGCGDSEELVEEESVAFEKLEGVVRKLGASIYQQGTHRLEKDGTLIALLESAGPQIKLDNFVDKEVEVEGIISPTAEGNLEIMKVVAITPRDSSTEGGSISYERYEDSQFGFSLKYPNDLKAQQTRRGAAFFDGDEKTIEIVILENTIKQELSDWLIDSYGYTADALRRVSVAGLTGYQFQNTTGSVIYLGNETQVFTLAWYDNSEENRARNRRYYLELVQSFAVAGVNSGSSSTVENSGESASEGEFCGGIAGIVCAGNLTCRLSGNYPDAGGICVAAENPTTPEAITSDQIGANDDLPEISAAELQRGWYYGDRDQKKPGTPMTWILVNSNTRSAMWRRLDNSPAEPTVELLEATAVPSQLSTEQREVLEYLQTNISTLALENPNSGEWMLSQLAFADPNFVYAIYIAGNPAAETQTRRLLLVYTVADGEVQTEMQAYFRPGTEQDWIVVEGADTAFGKAQTVVNASGELIFNISEGYRLFTDYGNGLSFQYPTNWYWRKPSAGKIEFSDQPFPAGISLLTVKVVSGANFVFDELLKEGEEQVIYVAFDSGKSVRISAEAGYKAVLLVAAETFELR